MALIIQIKVVPSSGRPKWLLNKKRELTCYIKSPPQKGLANKELIKLLARTLRISQHAIQIITGAHSRKKKIKIDVDITYTQLLNYLGLEEQQNLF